MKSPIKTLNQNIHTPDSKEIMRLIETDFLGITKNIILDNLDMSDEWNRSFFNNPDDPKEHKPKWHQWGIITHTKRVKEFYKKEIPQHLELWGMIEKIKSDMQIEIDGKSKNELFEIAIMFHDLGKFSDRKMKCPNDITAGFNFHGHEKVSGEIIRSPQFNHRLKETYRLSNQQIEYIAHCAELHYTLGKIRKQEKDNGNEYTIDFARSDSFRQISKDIIDRYKEYSLEVGLFFLADSLGKTDVRINTQNNDSDKNQDDTIRQIILDRKLNPDLFKSIKEIPISVEVVKNYLEIWINQQ